MLTFSQKTGLPYLPLHPEHAPVDFFAMTGFGEVVKKVGRESPVYDKSGDTEDERDHAEYLAARHADACKVASWLKSNRAENAVRGSINIENYWTPWTYRMPGLTTWAGQQTLGKIIRDRQSAMPAEPPHDLFAFTAPIFGVSGFDATCATNALEAGFSIDGMAVATRVYVEVLAVIGLSVTPIIVFPDGSFGYDAEERRWRFEMEARTTYYRRWGMSRAI